MKYIKKLINRKSIIILILLILVSIILFFKNKVSNYEKKNIEKVETLQDKQKNIKEENDIDLIITNIKNENIILTNNIKSLENELLILKSNIENLKQYVSKIENQNPFYNENNLKIMVLINKIQKLYYFNKDFVKEFEYLKKLSKNKSNDLFELIMNLNNYKISNNDFKKLNDVFIKEYKSLLLSYKNNKDDNILKDFISDNIKIRKLNDKNINESQYDKINLLINNISNEIQNGNYVNAISIIEENNYNNNVFKNTYNLLKRINNFCIVVDGVIDLVV